MENKNIIATDFSMGEPTCLSKIRTSRRIIDILTTHIDAFFNDQCAGREAKIGPLLLTGPAGTGKRLVAKACAATLGLNIKSINGNNLNYNMLCSFFLDANETTDCLFIDESQGIRPQIQERMLTILSENYIEIPSQSNKKKVCQIHVPNVPLILGCMSEHNLITALKSRMRIIARFDYYSIEDLIYIVQQRAILLNWQVESEQIYYEACNRAKRIPRNALRNLQLCWNVARSMDRDIITLEHAHRAFYLNENDEHGLDYLERSYLRILQEQSPLALNISVSKLAGGGINTQTVKTIIEPYMIMENFIAKDGSLRLITEKGLTHLQNTQFRE